MVSHTGNEHTDSQNASLFLWSANSINFELPAVRNSFLWIGVLLDKATTQILNIVHFDTDM